MPATSCAHYGRSQIHMRSASRALVDASHACVVADGVTTQEKSLFMAKASVQMLEAAKADTRAGQRNAARAAKAAASSQNVLQVADDTVTSSHDDGADQPKRGKGQGKTASDAAEAPGAAAEATAGGAHAAGDASSSVEIPELAGGKFLQIDLDAKAYALSAHLRKRKTEYRKVMAEYHAEVLQAESLIAKHVRSAAPAAARRRCPCLAPRGAHFTAASAPRLCSCDVSLPVVRALAHRFLCRALPVCVPCRLGRWLGAASCGPTALWRPCGRAPCDALRATLFWQMEMEAARSIATGDGDKHGSKAHAPLLRTHSASAGITDIHEQVGDFAAMVMPKAPPPLKLLLAPEEIPPLIAVALLATADKINAGQPIDATRSIAAAGRGNA